MSPPQGFLGPTALLPFWLFEGLASSSEKHFLGDTNMPAQVFSVKRIPPQPPSLPIWLFGGKNSGF